MLMLMTTDDERKIIASVLDIHRPFSHYHFPNSTWNSHSWAVDLVLGETQMILNTSENVHGFCANTVLFYMGTLASKDKGSHGALKPLLCRYPAITNNPSVTSQGAQ